MKAFQIARHLLPFTRYLYEGELVACPVCGFDRQTPIARLDRRFKRLPTDMCDRCGLLYTNPMPTGAELDHYYARYYRLDYQVSISAPSGRHLRKRSAEARERMERARPYIPTNARTLDFGAGSGEFVSAMLDAGFDAYGFEPGENYGSHARAKLGDRIQMVGWQDAQFEQKFDLVTSFHVLEHLSTPVEAIRAMVSWLKPDGKVFIVVPDMQRLAYKGFGTLHFAHVVGFNRHNLQYAAGLAGLRLIETINPTKLIFERGTPPDMDELARLGLASTRAGYIEASPVRSYLSYQLRKAGIGPARRAG